MARLKSKKKRETFCKEYKDGDLKDVDIPKKIINFQCSWVNEFGNSFRFHSNLAFKRHVKSFPHCYRDILLNWKIYPSQKPEVPSYILSQSLWYNQYIQIDQKSVHLAKFSDKNINTVSQLYYSNNFFINWDVLEERYKLQGETYF